MSIQPFRPWDFEPKRAVGRGAFGVVALAQKTRASPARAAAPGTPVEVYAIKVVDKASLVGSRSRSLARLERDVLDMIAHKRVPFVAKLRFAFQSPSRLYLAMDYYPAGSLDALLDSNCFRRKDAVASARLVGAELACALAKIHELCVVHRDVKPSNVLVDGRGHVHLSDFGLATKIPRADGLLPKRSFAGTVNYAAPELLLKSSDHYGAAVDLWALGCLLYEMLSGRPPFEAPTARETFALIAGSCDPEWPTNVDDDALVTLQHLLSKDPTKRLTSRGAPDSRWWARLDFNALDGASGPLASVAAVIVECAAMEEDEDDPHLAHLFKEEDADAPSPNADAFAGFGRPESVARPNLAPPTPEEPHDRVYV